jgi:nicotinamidase-related amidase
LSCPRRTVVEARTGTRHHGSFASQHQVEPYTQGQLDGLVQTFWPDHCVQNGEGAALHPLPAAGDCRGVS